MTPADYRVFAGAFPQGAVAERIQALREQYDPKTASITPPHVTLAGTYWRSGPATAENEAEAIARLASARRQIEPFELVLSGIHSFLPATAVIYLAVEPAPGLLAAREILQAALGRDKHRHFVPHLTLTMRLGHRATEALLAELQRSFWHTSRWVVPLEELWFMQRGPADAAWRRIQRLPLADP